MKKALTSIIVALVVTSIVAAASAVVKVNVLEERQQNQKEMLIDIKDNVKKILGILINGKNICCKRGNKGN